ncbi:YdhK family protein [Bacillus sp. USDA818B3_A]|uniref:YdhK family protein n=1 Tax=Bacillus sp. USDA818B3_A TaxID=2698834 RepID=UPI00136FACBB|nr:YdhK family protein [Bacillus sp. USDA818B3_A]
MKKNKWLIGLLITFAFIFLLSACSSSSNDHGNHSKSDNETKMDHEHMNMNGSGEVPEGLKEAENPTYKVGSQAIINADHMEGMKGAEATIVGAYDTWVYSISYEPTTGEEKVSNHKWVIHEEIKNAGTESFKVGDKVTVEADHMEGMDGAEATIDSVQRTTVYMVNYTPADGGEKVTNHKWVIESELSTK